MKPGITYILGIQLTKRGYFSMNNKLAQFAMISTKVNRQHIQVVLALLALAMLVLGIGAPSDGGGSPHGV